MRVRTERDSGRDKETELEIYRQRDRRRVREHINNSRVKNTRVLVWGGMIEFSVGSEKV